MVNLIMYKTKDICKITGLRIDKLNGDIAFNEEAHKYWSVEDGIFYSSVTGMISSYNKPYDSIMWSKYKTLQNEFPQYYKKVNKLEREVRVDEARKLMLPEELEQLDILSENLRTVWSQEAQDAIDWGHKVHKEKELQLLKLKEENIPVSFNHLIENIYFNVTTDIDEFLSKGNFCFPEMLLYSKKFKISGQADLVLKTEDDFFFIIDYKTNKEITFNNRYQKLLPPLDDLDSCKYNSYSIQLNSYAFLLKEMFPHLKFFRAAIFHFPKIGQPEMIFCSDYSNRMLGLMQHFYLKRQIF